jgi:hypothetical protein
MTSPSDLLVGQRMIRLEDGQRGVVLQNGPELRIMYFDRGEERLALKSENWAVDAIEPGPMREDEQVLVALHADRALRAYERNEPLKTWEQVVASTKPYDQGLFDVIVAYLDARKTRPASGE